MLDDLPALIECHFCSSPGRVSYHRVPLCTWHLMLLYLGINMLESRNRA